MLESVTSIQVADQGFIAAPPHEVAEVTGDAGNWRRWWPELALAVRQDRGVQGVRWSVAGPLNGTMEVWLEPMLDGTVIHYFLHAEPADGAGAAGAGIGRINRRYRAAGKAMVFEAKSVLECDRPAGEPPR